jgi:hypothetical protein
MEVRERTYTPDGGGGAPATPGGANAGRSQFQQGSRFAAASRAAIERSLSNDSTTFLSQTRQQGGQ